VSSATVIQRRQRDGAEVQETNSQGSQPGRDRWASQRRFSELRRGYTRPLKIPLLAVSDLGRKKQKPQVEKRYLGHPQSKTSNGRALKS
jgi:hypothetical protein